MFVYKQSYASVRRLAITIVAGTRSGLAGRNSALLLLNCRG